MDGYVLTVGGQEVGVAASEADLQALLDRVAEPYITEDTVDYGFVEDVSITSRQIPLTPPLTWRPSILPSLPTPWKRQCM